MSDRKIRHAGAGLRRAIYGRTLLFVPAALATGTPSARAKVLSKHEWVIAYDQGWVLSLPENRPVRLCLFPCPKCDIVELPSHMKEL
jgi:hypothetical protein